LALGQCRGPETADLRIDSQAPAPTQPHPRSL
jgi:hypothetical protein